jgi:transcriptional regulator with XRE-family HTH domain
MASRRSQLIRRREELGLSQEHLAALIVSDRTTVGRIERGQTTPQPQTRDRLSKALRVAPEQLTELLIPDGVPRPAATPALATLGGVVADPHTTGVIDMYRRELLRLLSVAGTLVLLPPARPPKRSLRLNDPEISTNSALSTPTCGKSSVWPPPNSSSTRWHRITFACSSTAWTPPGPSPNTSNCA